MDSFVFRGVQISAPTSDNIEMRICANDEDIPVGYYDIYVK